MEENTAELLSRVINIAKIASKAILEVYNSDKEVEVNIKLDNSPVTNADLRSHNILIDGLKKLTPTLPIISEEAEVLDYNERKLWGKFWLIDPLDGTKEFLHGTDEFTINIALIEKSQPILGVVFVPTRNTVYFASCKNKAYKQIGENLPQQIAVSDRKGLPIRVTISRHYGSSSIMRELLQGFGDFELVECGSTLKLCLIAEGSADIYPRLGPTQEWDTAAGQYILEAAGGGVTDLRGGRLRYNKKSLINPNFVAYSNLELVKELRI